mmetsp:Transcript_28900/g.43644  ORF Transcript_28900/g.43644 Transcript_28900/m.43644 type:complete len:394 (-) Transcript_28900:109-1290(-)
MTKSQSRANHDESSKTTAAAAPKKPRKHKGKSGSSHNDRKVVAAKIYAVNAASGGKNDRAAAIAAAIGRGVTMRPSGKWQAQLYYAGQSRYIGVFDSREKATLAYEIAREMLKGGDAPKAPGPGAERAVEMARKAAFAGVNEEKSMSLSSSTSASTILSTPSSDGSIVSLTTSDSSGGRRSSLKAITAAEILNGIASGLSQESKMATVEDKICLPTWIESNKTAYGERLLLDEWCQPNDRSKRGWKGLDFIHHENAPVRITDYFVHYGNSESDKERGGVGTKLTGIVHFTSRAESHKGICHGGSMTAVLNDIIAWTAFMVTGNCQPWSGFATQISTSIHKPISLDSWMLVTGIISEVKERQVTVLAKLIDPRNNDTIHADGDGLVILDQDVIQ